MNQCVKKKKKKKSKVTSPSDRGSWPMPAIGTKVYLATQAQYGKE